MKNLFKSLMLVAVAAMGFTSCQKEELPTQTGAEKFTIDVIANLEETRSAFGEKSENAYPSYWQGGEKVKAAILKHDSSINFIEVSESKEATIAVSGTQTAQLTLEWDYMSQTSGTMLIAVPYGSVTFDGSNYYFDGAKPGFVVNVPTEQTPLVNSVDPAAHILTATYEGSFSKTIMPEFVHAAAYGKMTLKNFDGEIDNVVVTIDSKSYVLNADNVANNVFWFGCEANETPETVTIAVNTTDDKSYTKTLDLTAGNGNGLPFSKGCVAEFGVDMDGIAAEEGAVVFAPTNTLDMVSVTTNYIEFYREYVGNGTPHSMNTKAFLRIYMHSNDRGNNYINVGEYGCLGTGAYVPGTAGEVNMRYTKDDYWTSPSTANDSSTLSVSFVKGEYVIIATINGETWGYKGMPDGWVAPANGGDVTPEPEPTQLAQPTNLTATATADTATITWTAVANASSYDVKVGETTKNVTDTTATFEGLTAETTYNVSVVAVGDGTNYTNSTAATTTVKTLAASTGGDEESIPEGYKKCEFVSLSKGKVGFQTYSWIGAFEFNYDGATISFTMCDFNGGLDVPNKKITEGEYVNNGNGANMDTKELYNISVDGMSGNTGSKVEVSKDGDVYTFLMTFITGAGTFNLYYQGTL